MKIRLSGLVDDSIVDGSGLRFTVFVQGCPHHCDGCHNPATHDFSGGYDADTADIWQQISANPLLAGVTFSGGEPFCQPKPLVELAELAKAHGLNVWAYTGYVYEDLARMAAADGDISRLLDLVDVLVDGPFILREKSLELKFRGSRNQRLIDMAATRRGGRVTLYRC